MLSEEDGRLLSPSEVMARHAGIEPCHRPLKSSACCFFLTDTWEEENGRAQGVESLSEK